MQKNYQYLLAWIVFSILATFLATLFDTAAIVDGEYIPVGNDSFYHARRIIDAAIGERGFYEFDTMIHVPDGSWINWPWGYDLIMAGALRIALFIRPDIPPMAFLAYVPVFFVTINAGWMTAIARDVRLSPGLTAIGLFVFSLLPLTQTVHGLGRIDHHFLEVTFVLMTLFFGLRLFARPTLALALTLGVTLGFASAFHNGLFILQIPVLICLFILWIRGAAIPTRVLLGLALATVLSTLLVALPSAALHDVQFEFWTLSWFHPYIALCTTVVIAFFAYRKFNWLNLAAIAGIGVLLALPLLTKILIGSSFVSGQLDIVAEIVEVKSPVVSALGNNGLRWVASQYSALFFLAPLLLLIHLVRLTQTRDPAPLYFSIWLVFGTALMFMQYRLHPFGSWALIIGSLLLLQQLLEPRKLSQLATTALALALVAIALQAPLRNQLFTRAPPGLSRDYAATRFIYPSLARACAHEPGAVLAYADDGHPIRYHTDCSVIANNFLMTPFHEQKLLEHDTYLQMTPQQLLEEAPHIRYVFVRMFQVVRKGPDGIGPTPLEDVIANNAPLFVALTFSAELPDSFRLIEELRVDDERDFAFARVFEIRRD